MNRDEILQRDSKQSRCVICGKMVRGTNKLFQICSRHYVPVERKKCCWPQGCNRHPNNPRNLFCCRHDESKKQIQKQRRQDNLIKPFLKGIEELEKQLDMDVYI